MMANWICALELDESRKITAGSEAELCAAIRRGADLRVRTAFRHNENVDTVSSNPELIREVMDFRVTYLLEDRSVAAVEQLRMPVSIPDGFGARASMSFFMYNQDGGQAIARAYLDGRLGPSPVEDSQNMPKYQVLNRWDADTNAPSENFIEKSEGRYAGSFRSK